MNEWGKYVLGVLLCCACLVSNACRTLPSVDTSKTDGLFVDVIDTQTKVVDTGNDVEKTIVNIKVITDDAKGTGEIPKDKIVTLIKYVDHSSEQIKAHNEIVKDLTGKITELEKSRQEDNGKYAKQIDDMSKNINKLKPFRSRFFVASGVILLLVLAIAVYIVLKVKKLLIF